jgi:hypothetical protein
VGEVCGDVVPLTGHFVFGQEHFNLVHGHSSKLVIGKGAIMAVDSVGTSKK